MCGIWGKVFFERAALVEDLVDPVRLLSHRGPDGYGWHLQENVAILHTRLSIIDLTGGAQPLQSSSGKFWGVVNGELYDYEKYRTHLRAEGVNFKTQSDSEVLLNLFAQRGVQALEGLSGEFAFIFYNPLEKLLYFGRDGHGVKPLFYQKTKEGFTLASEMKALSHEKPELDETYTKLFIARLMIPPQTSLKDVKHVLPGRLYRLDTISGELSWELFQKPALLQRRSLSKEEALEAVERELLKSVERRLVADVEVGCYLSGGIDSALVTAMAVKLGAKPKAFTVGFSDKDLDESDRARMVSSHLGIDHSVVTLSGKNFFSSLKKSIVAFENPITNPHGAAKNLLSEHASKSVKVVLSGEGADEWLGGYAYLRIKKLNHFLKKFPRSARELSTSYSEKESRINMGTLDGKSQQNHTLVKEFFAGKAPSLFGRVQKHRMFNYLTGSSLSTYLEDGCKDLARLFEEEFPGQMGIVSEWDLDTWIALRTDLLHYILANVGDRQEMSHSLEGRTPFMDPLLTKVMGQVPEKYLIHGLTEKWVLKEIAAKYLPPEIWQHRKHPFFAPMKYLYTKDSREGMKHYIQVAKENTPWLNWKHIDRLLDQEKAGADNAFEGMTISMKLILFSLGVIVQDLRHSPAVDPRGYELPKSGRDLIPFRKI
jgi:asparagine synthase (glutamine-hydrolysing)